jgi:hypothetical protein
VEPSAVTSTLLPLMAVGFAPWSLSLIREQVTSGLNFTVKVVPDYRVVGRPSDETGSRERD